MIDEIDTEDTRTRRQQKAVLNKVKKDMRNLNIHSTNFKNLISSEEDSVPIITCKLTKVELLQFMERPI